MFCNTEVFLYRRGMCIKLSYVNEKDAVFVVLRQTPFGVEEHPMQEISVFTVQGVSYSLPEWGRYFAAIDPLAGWTSCLIHVQVNTYTQSIEKISLYTVQNWNPDLKADPSTKMTRGILPFYVALYGNAWMDHIAWHTFDSFNLYCDNIVYGEEWYQYLERMCRYLDIDADQKRVVRYDAKHVSKSFSEDQRLQIDMSYKIGEYYETKIKKDISVLSETLHIEATTDRMRSDFERLWYFSSVTVQVQEKDIPIQALSAVSLQVSQRWSVLKYTNMQQPAMSKSWILS